MTVIHIKNKDEFISILETFIVDSKHLDNINNFSGDLRIKYGQDEMNMIVSRGLEFNKESRHYNLIDVLYIVRDGVMTFYDYDTHKKFATTFGISTGYRRRPLTGKPTIYKPSERYGYAGDEDLEKKRTAFKEVFKQKERLRRGYVNYHKCGKCSKDTYKQ